MRIRLAHEGGGTGAVLAVVLAFVAGCGGAPVPVLGAGPFEDADAALLDDALTAARTAGYRPTAIEREHGRFEVVARSDGRGATRFVVQCFADGWISIVARGPRVREEADGRFSMPSAVRTEYTALAEEIDRTVTVLR